MSTKIYTGFLVKHGRPDILMRQLKALQIEYTENARRVLSGILPAGSLLGPNEPEIIKKIDEVYKDRLMADVVIYFKKNRILGTYFIHDRELEKKFRSQSFFKDYHYQNQSDPDETVSTKEWNQRRKDWDFIDVPANDGFTFYLVNPAEIKPFWIACWRRDNLPQQENRV